MFKSLQLRYQTARSLPAPDANFYTLTATPSANGSLDIDFSITFPDRDDIDDDELIAEGYTRHDDFSWRGRLPHNWQRSLADIVSKTRLDPIDEDELDEDDDFLDLSISEANGQQRQGRPRNLDEWQYLAHELMQAAYEAGGREAPFELSYVDFENRDGDREINLSASFVARDIRIEVLQGRREERKTLPWSELQPIMRTIYSVEFAPEEALPNRPRNDGQYLSLGTDDWYRVDDFPAIVRLFRSL
jgi:hypothetical protein